MLDQYGPDGCAFDKAELSEAQEKQFQLEYLIAFLNSHDVGANPTYRGKNQNGTIRVACWVFGNGEGKVQIDNIPANLGAAKDWLGY
jgi:hypothetical protein